MIRKLRKKDWFHPDGFPIVVERRDPQEPFGLHSHEFSEIVIITGGKGVHITGEDTYELTAGDTFVIGGDRPHDYLNMDCLRLINVLYDASELPMSFSDLLSLPGYHTLFTLEPAWRKRHMFSSRLQLSPAELADAIRLVDQLGKELDERGPGFGVMATTTLLQLATFLSRCYSRSRNPQSKSLLRIAEAIAHIESHHTDPITLDELIEISGMSRRSFIRTFELAMGIPPIKYLIRRRIQHACQLLQQTDQSITSIAMAVGFSDSNYFSRQFRLLNDASPREYRNRKSNPHG
ncbi:AraC family transcriptional regulator, L-rhamnose operon transcriptional activator RhaR [Neorhodopirellula lusitana]|uniref:AraC family transcriptional regulator, L-rhamnose operon transcriptional activator RhaR n=1 Tax=Neorhodopirellula lusitana TaxID=445327 RepID=A0ABY1PRY8_9BACT|nr:helix-turn-helix domain-containing protein [Neorhodopirellula lusitana]SMP43942.1 AraC family transcriptional regulator, L-rhamnose operon transcriptional activator RhaR [Neorhodopirellula lusitana]